MDIIGVSTEYLIKKWNQTKENVLNFQRKKAEEFPCEIECRALEIHNSKYFRIKTPLTTFNNMTNGGFQSATVTELVGPPGSGKSQFCLSLIANYLTTDLRNVVYIDTNKNFSFNRIFQMWNSNINEPLTNAIKSRLNQLYLIEPLSKDEFVDIFDNLETYMAAVQPSVIIVDSMAYYIRGIIDVIKRVNLSSKLIALIKKYAAKYKVMIIVTNQITGFNNDGGGNSALGTSWLHHLNLRIYFDFYCTNDKKKEDFIVRKVVFDVDE